MPKRPHRRRRPRATQVLANRYLESPLERLRQVPVICTEFVREHGYRRVSRGPRIDAGPVALIRSRGQVDYVGSRSVIIKSIRVANCVQR
jgi:hypothetical protein